MFNKKIKNTEGEKKVITPANLHHGRKYVRRVNASGKTHQKRAIISIIIAIIVKILLCICKMRRKC